MAPQYPSPTPLHLVSASLPPSIPCTVAVPRGFCGDAGGDQIELLCHPIPLLNTPNLGDPTMNRSSTKTRISSGVSLILRDRDCCRWLNQPIFTWGYSEQTRGRTDEAREVRSKRCMRNLLFCIFPYCSRAIQFQVDALLKRPIASVWIGDKPPKRTGYRLQLWTRLSNLDHDHGTYMAQIWESRVPKLLLGSRLLVGPHVIDVLGWSKVYGIELVNGVTQTPTKHHHCCCVKT